MTEPRPLVPVVELLRVSTEAQAAFDRAGLPAQHATNVRTCEAYGLSVIESIEVVETGVEVAQSAEMQRIMDLIVSGTARGVVLAEYSRLFRPDRWSDLIVLQTFADHDAHIYLPSGPIDLQSEVGFVQATINNLLAAMERRRIRERMHRGKEEHRRRGGHPSSPRTLPFGLAYSKERGWEYTPDIEIPRMLFRDYLGGEHNLAELGRRYGVPRSTVRYILSNEVYAGWRAYDQKCDQGPNGRYPGGSRKMVPRAPHEVIRVRLPLEPIVSEEDFALVQQLMASRAKVRAPNGSWDRQFLYRGYLWCASPNAEGAGDCGMRMYIAISAQPNGNRKPYYRCKSFTPALIRAGGKRCQNGYLHRDKLEPVIDEVIAERLTDPDVLLAALAAYRESREAAWREQRPDMAVLADRLAALRKQRERVIDLYVEGTITKEERDRRLAPIAMKLAAAERMERDEPAVPPELDEAAVLELATAFAEWPLLPWDARRKVLEALDPRIYVRKYEVCGIRFPLSAVAGRGDVKSVTHPRMADVLHITKNCWDDAGFYVPLSA